jgi:hypothetical protein
MNAGSNDVLAAMMDLAEVPEEVKDLEEIVLFNQYDLYLHKFKYSY